MAAPDGIDWHPWSNDAFARARSEARPVLLAVTAAWCPCCAEMDRTSFADVRIIDLVRSRFVPIRVDADRRPDVGCRYGLGGWPTTAVLTPEGEVLCGGTYVDADRLAAVLAEVHAAYAAGDHRRGRPAPPAPSSEPCPAPLPRLLDQVFDSFDRQHGGCGEGPKFPLSAPIRLALDVYRTDGLTSWRDIAIASLDAMGWGALYDEQHGGFFRYAAARDWSGPGEEKLLDDNAAMLSLYVDAFEALQLARYAERAEDVLRFVQNWLADPAGGWGGSQPGHVRAAAHGDPREGRADRRVDTTLFTNWNAGMVSAALHAGRVMEDAALSEFAIRSLERVVLLCYRPGMGVAHYASVHPEEGSLAAGDVRGLLDDQVAMATAHLDAFEATGNVAYEMMAEELALYAVRTMWDEAGGGFFDRAGDAGADIGLLRDPVKPFAANCAAARMLRRLARVSGSAAFAGYADRALAGMAGRAAGEGALAAEYVLAVRQSGR